MECDLYRDIEYLQLQHTCGHLHLYGVADLFAEQCLGDRGAYCELTLAEVCLVLGNDSIDNLAVVVVVGAAGTAWWYLQNRPTVAPAVVVQEVVAPAPETIDSMAVEEVVEPRPVEEVVVPESTAIGRITSGVSYVVVGVFSTEENARKYIEQMARRNPEIACRVYAFQGSKFMVSGFESTDGAEASAFIRDHRAALPDLWVYKRK